MHKIQMLAFSVFFVGLSVSAKTQLDFRLPVDPTGQIANKIENIQAQDQMVVIAHRLGVSVSTDGGQSFKPSQIVIN